MYINTTFVDSKKYTHLQEETFFMKKTFPIITILVTISLFGLIFFQLLWIKSVKTGQEQKLKDNVSAATAYAGVRLMEEKVNSIFQKKSDLFIGEDRFQLDFRKHAVMRRFSKDEIKAIINEELIKANTKPLQFEFAVTDNNIASSDQITSENFFKFSADTSTNVSNIVPLQARGGSDLENFTPQEYLVVIVPNQHTIILKQLFWFILGAIIFTLIIVTAFFLTLRTLFVQKKLGEIKSDFINNMTHEFKTPLATISLAVDALKNVKVVGNKEKTDYFTDVIKEENIRMNKQVETILQAALLEKQEVQLNLKKLSTHDLISDAINNISLPLNEKNGDLEVHLDAVDDYVMVDEVHFTNFVNNLLDNALKYSKEKPVIKLSTANVGNNIRIRIEDSGIGMSKETLSRIFEKFYRAHTGNVHNVKGFGLGLSYVKTLVEAHKGTIKAESTLGKGSIFTISFPLAKNNIGKK
jgi:two-component system, OmpR family, phosphate regulon sensor histidine kinase PhoR